MKNYKPILFSTPMVQALLEDKKTMTRRTKGLEGLENYYFQSLVHHTTGKFTFVENDISQPTDKDIIYRICPYQIGNILWVRETFCKISENQFEYKVGNTNEPIKWKPSIFMPKEVARIFLKVTAIRVERLQNITRGDAMNEGCPFPNIAKETNPWAWFAGIWQQINGFNSWNDNPFVWVIEFQRVEKPENFI